MPWVKLDDQFSVNDKILAASKDGRELYFSTLGHCARNLTDGFIDADLVRQLGALFEVYDVEPAIAKLLEVGLWEEAEGGYQIDWVGCSIVGIGETTQTQRKTRDYKRWRKAVLKRDDYTCQSCGAKPKRLHAHHILPWATNRAMRYKVSNGLTVCEACHKAIHYGSDD